MISMLFCFSQFPHWTCDRMSRFNCRISLLCFIFSNKRVFKKTLWFWYMVWGGGNLMWKIKLHLFFFTLPFFYFAPCCLWYCKNGRKMPKPSRSRAILQFPVFKTAMTVLNPWVDMCIQKEPQSPWYKKAVCVCDWFMPSEQDKEKKTQPLWYLLLGKLRPSARL